MVRYFYYIFASNFIFMWVYRTEEEKYEILVNLLTNLLGNERKHYDNKHQIAFDCPVCSAEKGVESDGKGNLEINYDKGVYNCWACGEVNETKGTIYKLFRTFGTYEQVNEFLSYEFSFNGKDGEVTYKEKTKIILPDETYQLNLKLHPERLKDPLFKPAYDYLFKRKIFPDIINKFNLQYCVGGKFRNRIVIPSYDNNADINYYVTRSLYNIRNKYINNESDKTQLIFNELFIDWDKDVYLVEGPFDHLVLPNSLVLLGKKMYDLMFETIYKNLNPKCKLIIVLDPDAIKDTIKIYNMLNGGKLRGRVFVNFMPKDIDVSKFNELYGQEELLKWVKKIEYLKEI